MDPLHLILAALSGGIVAMPQKPVAPATNRPAPTKALRPQKAGCASVPRRAPTRIRPPAAICT
ncbi:hypothetical protein D3C85_1637990 [compost metagenome]